VEQLMEGNQIGGIALLVMVVVLMGLDNTVRPWFLRGAANLHPLLAFVAALGGLQTIGFLGVFLGPIVASLFVFTIRLLTHRQETV
jgi:predicted PurR-regulated permease PerM